MKRAVRRGRNMQTVARYHMTSRSETHATAASVRCVWVKEFKTGTGFFSQACREEKDFVFFGSTSMIRLHLRRAVVLRDGAKRETFAWHGAWLHAWRSCDTPTHTVASVRPARPKVNAASTTDRAHTHRENLSHPLFVDRAEDPAIYPAQVAGGGGKHTARFSDFPAILRTTWQLTRELDIFNCDRSTLTHSARGTHLQVRVAVLVQAEDQ